MEEAEGANLFFNCPQFEYSVLFVLLFMVIGISFVIYAIVLMTKRPNKLTGLDILWALLFLCAEMKFAVKLWRASGVILKYLAATQTACKLAALTQTGMSHVVSYILLLIILYQYLAMKWNDVAWLNGQIRKNLGWIVCLIFALEGAFGMVPSIYTEASKGGQSCNSTQSFSMNLTHYVTVQILLQAILPYLLPFALMSWPLWHLIRIWFLDSAEILTETKENMRNVIVCGLSYALLHLPMVMVTLVTYPRVYR